MYLENDKYQHRDIAMIALFVTHGMPRRGILRHLCMYIVSYLVIFLRVGFIACNVFPLHVNKSVLKYFKHYYNDGNYLVLKYVFIYVSKGPIVLEYKIHRQRPCTKIIGTWHPLTVLFMISPFKGGLLFI